MFARVVPSGLEIRASRWDIQQTQYNWASSPQLSYWKACAAVFRLRHDTANMNRSTPFNKTTPDVFAKLQSWLRQKHVAEASELVDVGLKFWSAFFESQCFFYCFESTEKLSLLTLSEMHSQSRRRGTELDNIAAYSTRPYFNQARANTSLRKTHYCSHAAISVQLIHTTECEKQDFNLGATSCNLIKQCKPSSVIASITIIDKQQTMQQATFTWKTTVCMLQ